MRALLCASPRLVSQCQRAELKTCPFRDASRDSHSERKCGVTKRTPWFEPAGACHPEPLDVLTGQFCAKQYPPPSQGKTCGISFWTFVAVVASQAFLRCPLALVVMDWVGDVERGKYFHGVDAEGEGP